MQLRKGRGVRVLKLSLYFLARMTTFVTKTNQDSWMISVSSNPQCFNYDASSNYFAPYTTTKHLCTCKQNANAKL